MLAMRISVALSGRNARRAARRRQRLPMGSARRLARFFLAILTASASALAFGPAAAPATPPTDGFERLVDVGGHRLYVKCTGRGGPTVILEAGLGGFSTVWSAVQSGVANFTTVCSYDRTNLGSSDRVAASRTTQTSVDELRALVQNAGIRGPYVLVGASYGGWLAQLFARQDAGRRVTGVVLVDATPIDFPDWAHRFGFSTVEENDERIDLRASSDELQAAPEFPHVPLDVLRQTVFRAHWTPEFRRFWDERQEAASELSCRGRLITAQGAGHRIHEKRPDLVIASIERVVKEAGSTNARRLHPQGHASPAEPDGGAGSWRACQD